MKTYIILLRGVMPTGKNKVPIALLRAALEKAGLKNVRTYIQSGNVVAESSLSQSRIEKLVHDVIKKRFGGDIAVLARTAPSFAASSRAIRLKKPIRRNSTSPSSPPNRKPAPSASSSPRDTRRTK
jgi:uncharacterized protein (DUF1697 family)